MEKMVMRPCAKGAVFTLAAMLTLCLCFAAALFGSTQTAFADNGPKCQAVAAQADDGDYDFDDDFDCEDDWDFDDDSDYDEDALDDDDCDFDADLDDEDDWDCDDEGDDDEDDWDCDDEGDDGEDDWDLDDDDDWGFDVDGDDDDESERHIAISYIFDEEGNRFTVVEYGNGLRFFYGDDGHVKCIRTSDGSVVAEGDLGDCGYGYCGGCYSVDDYYGCEDSSSVTYYGVKVYRDDKSGEAGSVDYAPEGAFCNGEECAELDEHDEAFDEADDELGACDDESDGEADVDDEGDGSTPALPVGATLSTVGLAALGLKRMVA